MATCTLTTSGRGWSFQKGIRAMSEQDKKVETDKPEEDTEGQYLFKGGNATPDEKDGYVFKGGNAVPDDKSDDTQGNYLFKGGNATPDEKDGYVFKGGN